MLGGNLTPLSPDSLLGKLKIRPRGLLLPTASCHLASIFCPISFVLHDATHSYSHITHTVTHNKSLFISSIINLSFLFTIVPLEYLPLIKSSSPTDIMQPYLSVMVTNSIPALIIRG